MSKVPTQGTIGPAWIKRGTNVSGETIPAQSVVEIQEAGRGVLEIIKPTSPGLSRVAVTNESISDGAVGWITYRGHARVTCDYAVNLPTYGQRLCPQVADFHAQPFDCGPMMVEKHCGDGDGSEVTCVVNITGDRAGYQLVEGIGYDDAAACFHFGDPWKTARTAVGILSCSIDYATPRGACTAVKLASPVIVYHYDTGTAAWATSVVSCFVFDESLTVTDTNAYGYITISPSGAADPGVGLTLPAGTTYEAATLKFSDIDLENLGDNIWEVGAGQARSRSVSQSVSKCRSKSKSKGKLASQSRSRSASKSVSKSRYPSRSGSKSRSKSRTQSISKHTSVPSKSRSRSRSESVAESISHSRSASRIKSVSKQASASKSASKSKILSLSKSKSESRTKSESHVRSISKSWSKSASRVKSESKTRSASRSESVSQSASKILSASRSESVSRIRSGSKLRSQSKSASRVLSMSRSESLSQSVSKLQSHSQSRSATRSASASRFKSESRSASVTKSASKWMSKSKSVSKLKSRSITKSRSRSQSIERSRSKSESRSVSVSKLPSRSRSRSESESKAQSLSASVSESTSKQKSVSKRLSQSKSESRSVSISKFPSGSRSRSKSESKAQSLSKSTSKMISRFFSQIRSVSKSRSKLASQSRSKSKSKDEPHNACGSCDPAIPDTLTVVLSNLQGAFAVYNTAGHPMTWVSGCLWAWDTENYSGNVFPPVLDIEYGYWRVYWSIGPIYGQCDGQLTVSAGQDACSPWSATAWDYTCTDAGGDCVGTECDGNGESCEIMDPI